MQTLAEIAAAIKKLKSATIFTHTRPDGDTLGSALALSYALGSLGIPNEIVNDCDVPEKFFYLPDLKKVKKAPTFEAEGYICVDSSDENRLGDLASLYLSGAKKKVTVNIDHHVSNTSFAKYNFVRPCCANCRNMAELLPLLGVEIDKKTADALFLGLLTDSGNFSHSDVDGDAFRTAAKLLDCGADACGLGYAVFRKQTKARARLHAEAMAGIRYLLSDRLAILTVTQEMLSRTGADRSETEGFVDFALNVDTVEVAAALLEVRPRQYKVSLRSKGKANVNEAAATFGGGGHVLASGCMIFGEWEEVIDKLRFAVSRQLD